jgi:hypothetical protein
MNHFLSEMQRSDPTFLILTTLSHYRHALLPALQVLVDRLPGPLRLRWRPGQQFEEF